MVAPIGSPAEAIKSELKMNLTTPHDFEPLLRPREPEGHKGLYGHVLVDAVLGTGFRPPVSGLYAEAITAMNASGTPVVAVDIPSGADADAWAPQEGVLRARAYHVATFTAPRPAHVFAQLTRGETMIAPIGSPVEAIKSELKMNLITPADFEPLLRAREPDGHKGLYGHVLVIGGSLGKAGAAAMAGVAALRAGAGLSTVATPKSVLPTVAGFAPEVMTEPLAETDAGTIALAALEYNRVDELAAGKDVIALGPGISRHADTVQFVRAVVGRYPAALVIDADGLNAFEGAAERLDGSARTLVLTPHPGEMARLTGMSTKDVQARRIEAARDFATKHRCILVLKGHRTLVALASGELWVNTTGNPGMATGGTGDILTGMVAGALGQAVAGKQGLTPEQAVIAAVYLHGLAGDVACERVGEHSLIATDLLAGLPEAFKRAHAALTNNAVRF